MTNIDIKSSTIDKVLELTQNFLQKLIGPSIEEVGLGVADKVRVWRLNNQLKIFEKAKKRLKENNIPLRQINLKVMFPLIEGISLEEDEKLQDLWVNLLVNYIDETKNLTTHVYPEILRQLSTKDVEILENFYSVEIKYDEYGIPRRNVRDVLTYDPSDLANLERLGLINPALKVAGGGGPGLIDRLSSNIFIPDRLQVTNFGDKFYNACKK